MKKSLVLNGSKVEINLIKNRNGEIEFEFNGNMYSYNVNSLSNSELAISGDHYSKVIHDGNNFVVNGSLNRVENVNRSRSKSNSDHAGGMISPMPGKILKVMVSEGDSVNQGDALVVMEAMKMEHTIKASEEGVVTNIFFEENQLVDGGVELVSIESKE